MRTTIRLDPQFMDQVRRFAHESGVTLTRLIEEALREKMARRAPSLRKKPVRLPTFDGGGLRPGIDLDDSASLLDQMDAG